MKAPAELPGDLGNRQPVQVAQRQRCSLMGGKTGKGRVGSRDVKLRLPRVVHRLGTAHDHAEAALEVRSPPVVDQLVAGDAHQPGDSELRRAIPLGRRDSCHKRLRRQILGQYGAAAPRQEVSVDLGQGTVIQGSQWRLPARALLLNAHTQIIV
jgi:hypothetical protein